MATGTLVWIIVAAVAAIGVIAMFALLARTAHNRRRHQEAERIRDEITQEAQHVEKCEALADETEAKARAAQAEAEVKAREAARLQETATGHQNTATTSREELDARRAKAEALDPQDSKAERIAPEVDTPTERQPR